MKKFIYLFVLLLVANGVIAQKGKVNLASTALNDGKVEAAKEYIDAAFDHEKSKDWPKTYMTAAQVYSALYKAKKDTAGMEKAVDFYKKAIELDNKGDEKGKSIGKYKKEIKLALTLFIPEMTNAGVNAFNEKKFASAVKLFESIVEFNNSDIIVDGGTAIVDTAIIYNAAIAAYNGKMWEKAEEFFKTSIGYKYGGGDAVVLLHQVYVATGDSAKMGANLSSGFIAFPNDSRVLTTLINYYLSTNQDDEALNYINRAIEKDSSNPSLFYARGVLLSKTGKVDESIESYNKCLELDPTNFNTLYNIGVLFYNMGVEQMNKANDEKDYKKFEAAKVIADDYFKKALPYMEQAHEINATEVAVLESLKGLYYRFNNMEKYKEVQAKIDAL